MWLSSSHTIISYFYSGGAPHLRREHILQEVERRPDLTALICPQILELRNLGVVRNAEASITNKGHSERGNKIRKLEDLAAFFNCIFPIAKAMGQSSSLVLCLHSAMLLILVCDRKTIHWNRVIFIFPVSLACSLLHLNFHCWQKTKAVLESV